LRGAPVSGHPAGMTLSADQVREKLAGRQGWTLDGTAIRRQFVFDGFASALAFVVRVGFDAEAADHHPDILISSYKKVTLTFTTHSAGGLTEKDFAAAEAADRVFARQAG
jgi:4a-hydroxytetrahydrobiopterin dehydratase